MTLRRIPIKLHYVKIIVFDADLRTVHVTMTDNDAPVGQTTKRFIRVSFQRGIVVVKEKKLALRSCLNRRISFMKDCVYDCGSVSERYLKLHMDFIVTLQVLAAKLDA